MDFRHGIFGKSEPGGYWDLYERTLPSRLRRRHPADALEPFGGQGGVMKLCVRRGLRGGGNVDLTTNWNLLDPSLDLQELLFVPSM